MKICSKYEMISLYDDETKCPGCNETFADSSNEKDLNKRIEKACAQDTSHTKKIISEV